MKTEDYKISEIIPYANNPRNNEAAVNAVANSIREFGFKSPIVIDKNKVVVCGHTRLLAAKKLGLKEVPCVMADDLTDEQIKAYRLADNKVSELASWDLDLLKIEMDGIEDIDMSLFGFDDVSEDDDEPAEIIEDDVPEAPEIAKTKKGDIYILGEHRLMCGDSTDATDVAKLMDGDVANLLITDPPYNVAYNAENSVRRNTRHDNKKVENDDMDDEAFVDFLTLAFSNALSVMEAGASYYIWYAQTKAYWFMRALVAAGITNRQILIWVKQHFSFGRQDYQWRHEPCFYGWKDGAAHQWYSDRKQSTILEFDKPSASKEHPTMKPVGLFAYEIGNSSKKGDIVLDLFGGSGTTCVACEQLGRKARLMELSPDYCDVIVTRWENLTGKKAELIRKEDEDV